MKNEELRSIIDAAKAAIKESREMALKAETTTIKAIGAALSERGGAVTFSKKLYVLDALAAKHDVVKVESDGRFVFLSEEGGTDFISITDILPSFQILILSSIYDELKEEEEV